MKKLIKIFCLIIFILFICAITTSNAITVTINTNNEEMTNALEKNPEEILDFSDSAYSIYLKNDWIFCRQEGGHLFNNKQTTYTLDTRKDEDGKIEYPKDDIENNGYAIAYILGYGKAAKYAKADIQDAYWKILGQIEDNYKITEKAKELYDLAVAYQTFKKAEANKKTNSEPIFEINQDNAKTTFEGNELIYGPIEVTYIYVGEFGGFDYSVEGIDLSTGSVKLCNKDYENIDEEADGKIRTAIYNGEELYIKINLNEITDSKLKFNITYNSSNVEATVYHIKGSYNTTTGEEEMIFCIDCEGKKESANEDYAAAVEDKNLVVKYDNKYWKYTGLHGISFEDTITSGVVSPEVRYYYLYRFNHEGTTKTDTTTANVQIRDCSYFCTECVRADENTKNKTYLEAQKLLLAHLVEMHMGDIKDDNFSSKISFKCKFCGTTVNISNISSFEESKYYDAWLSHMQFCSAAKDKFGITVRYKSTNAYNFNLFDGCGDSIEFEMPDGSIEEIKCGSTVTWEKDMPAQNLIILSSYMYNDDTTSEFELEIPLTTSIEVVKNWNDNEDNAGTRPETIKFNVFRSIDQVTWEKLSENIDYEVEWISKEENTWKAIINKLLRMDDAGNIYYYKVEEQAMRFYNATYESGNFTDCQVENSENKAITITNHLNKVEISGFVWLDGQTGIKPAVPYNGIYNPEEEKLANIVVELYKQISENESEKIAETVTDEDGKYIFTDIEIGRYYVEFKYDGINYEDTIKGGDSRAFEDDDERNAFNERFETIEYKTAKDGTNLNYSYSNGKSILITNAENSTTILDEFIMNSKTETIIVRNNTRAINFGLVKRGMDIALSTDVLNADVTINGQHTKYTFNSSDETKIQIDQAQTSQDVSYNLNLYTSDYYYRIRNYVSNLQFTQNDYINAEEGAEIESGEELKVFVTYELNLQNQSTETSRINEVKYAFDEKYTFKQILDSSYTTTISGNIITINLNGLELKEGETKTLYLLFEVNNNEGLVTGNFSNAAEITSYSTDKGLIDIDSQPGNFINDNQIEDDSDTAGGLTIEQKTFERKITGKVFDENNNVNDVIVQLIELKTVNNKVYEYIWQETVSGTGKGLRLNATGTALEEYTYTKADGQYEFNGFIPGDYIVRFIYGDGTTYDMTNNVIKYNGQDYKSTEDANYNAEYYNSASYTEGASVARDNEARRLETMSYSVEVDAKKGMLLKLLNNLTVEDLNETEKEILISLYKDLYGTDITQVTQEIINQLLKEHTLKNTWMCAETSKIKVAVDTENVDNTNTTVSVNGITKNYVTEIPNINLGLELRPATKIELKKYITGFKLTAANGQTLVNAYVDVNEYLNNPTEISNRVQGLRDNVTILDTVWQYEVSPSQINTIVDGASLEFEYTIVVKNIGETDYLSAELANVYKTETIAEYKTLLANKALEIKGDMKNGSYNTKIGNVLGNSYYVGGTGANKVLTEITNIRDYVNNDLRFVTSDGDVTVDEDAPHTYRILRDDYTKQEATINTVLKTTRTTGKMANDATAVVYTVTLAKNPISSTGNLNFKNYIAEVMSFTNAAGRRVMYYTEDGELETATPGNAEIIDQYPNETVGKHEKDEADTARIQIGAATGEDGKTNYIIVTAVIVGIVLIAVGSFAVKRYVIK